MTCWSMSAPRQNTTHINTRPRLSPFSFVRHVPRFPQNRKQEVSMVDDRLYSSQPAFKPVGDEKEMETGKKKKVNQRKCRNPSHQIHPRTPDSPGLRVEIGT